VKTFYPPLGAQAPTLLVPFASQPLQLRPTEQRSFLLLPAQTKEYEIATFGETDTLIVLNERAADGSLTYLAGDDDSGEERNARLKIRLVGGREYELKVRLYYAQEEGSSAVMYW
jgi:hypothetical protein